MAFVPEGQADSSQARSAWVAMQRAPGPGGTVEVMVSPVVSPEWREVSESLGRFCCPEAEGAGELSAKFEPRKVRRDALLTRTGGT